MRNKRLQPAPPRWQALIDEHSLHLAAENKSDRTIRNYSDAARFFFLWIEHPEYPPEVTAPARWRESLPSTPQTPPEITPAHVQAFITYRIRTTSPGNAHNNYRGLNSFFEWLRSEGEITTHPMARMRPPHVPDQPPPVTLDELMKNVLATCTGNGFLNRRDEALIRLYWDTGARLSEIAGIQHETDLDLPARTARVLGKGGRMRSIIFSAKTARALGRYLRVRARQPQAHLPALWLTERQRGPLQANGIKLMIRRRGDLVGAREILGRNLHAHLGRHYQSHHFLASGGSEGDLMILNGWTTPQMPRRYGRSAAIDRAAVAARTLSLGDRL